MPPDKDEGVEYFQRDFKKAMDRIEFPRFEGDDPRGWISRAERYFRHFRTPEEGKVELASLHFEGDVNDWLDCFLGENSTPS